MTSRLLSAIAHWGRVTYAVLALLYALFVVYGSLVPFDFERLHPAEAVSLFRDVVSGPVRIDSRTDLAVNFLLFIPFGYFLMATLRTDARSRAVDAVAAVVTMAVGVVFAFSIEFAQLFFPSRVVALSDMLAESVGGVAGTVAWLAVGRELTTWLRGFSGERERPALLQRVLLLYSALFVASQTMPLDLTVSLGELAHKYRRGAIILRPFSFAHASWSAAMWDYVGDIALNAPLGAAAVLAWTTPGRRRHPLKAFALAVSVVGLIEFGQVFVMSRYADVTDVITGSVGAALGVVVASVLSSRPVLVHVGRRPERLALLGRLLTPVWLGIMAAYHWAPYNFSITPAQVTEGMHRLLQIPFVSYYLGTEFNAFTEMARKSALALPLGILLGAAWPVASTVTGARLRRVALALFGFALLCGIEVGQVFLPTRYPDLTDACIGEVGLLMGVWIAGMLTPQRSQKSEVRTQN
ncbi:MAG: VanZ family protein [Acidobacteria bacterium]|nr:VanZ family protein [Acidobacteriota bacterium]